MNKVKCTIQYDGVDFFGFQVQPRQRTVQGEIERALKELHKGDHVRIQSSGRTDRGVHAIGQVIHFETPLKLAEANWKLALNDLLPADLYIKEVIYTSASFHSRYDATEKEYRYIVDQSKEPNVFKQNYTYYFPYPLNLTAMQEACTYLEGEHDFTSFSSAKDTAKGSKVRTLYEVSCDIKGEELIFTFRGGGYLYHMVRIMVGTLLDIGRGRRASTDIMDMFAKKDRKFAGQTSPATGLYLWRVVYPD